MTGSPALDTDYPRAIMRLELLAAALVFTFSYVARAQDAGDCFSPDQNTEWVFQADAGPGCPCDSAIEDKVVCVNESPVACREDQWKILTHEEAPGCGAFYTPPYDPEPASWCAMSSGRGSRSGTLVAFTGLLVAAVLRRRSQRFPATATATVTDHAARDSSGPDHCNTDPIESKVPSRSTCDVHE